MNACRYYDMSASKLPSPKSYKPRNIRLTIDLPKDREASPASDLVGDDRNHFWLPFLIRGPSDRDIGL
jgi:hypothetical protein